MVYAAATCWEGRDMARMGRIRWPLLGFLPGRAVFGRAAARDRRRVTPQMQPQEERRERPTSARQARPRCSTSASRWCGFRALGAGSLHKTRTSWQRDARAELKRSPTRRAMPRYSCLRAAAPGTRRSHSKVIARSAFWTCAAPWRGAYTYRRAPPTPLSRTWWSAS